MMNSEGARPSVDRMTSLPQTCYFAGCQLQPKWVVASSVKQKNPDGSDLSLSTCDHHYDTLTKDLRKAGTKYALLPINGPHIVMPEVNDNPKAEPPPASFRDLDYEPETKLGKLLFNTTCVVVAVVIGPFIILYYAGRWILGYRPPFEGQQ
jgi:hypothetical protein